MRPGLDISPWSWPSWEISRLRGWNVSHTFVEIAKENAREAGVKIDFRQGSASEMLFASESFDFIYCSAAFKDFSEPVQALDEMYRVLCLGGEAVIMDPRKDAPSDEIDAHVNRSERGRIDAWITKWTFQHVLLRRAYRKDDFVRMAEQSRFGTCQLNSTSISLEVRFAKPARGAAALA